MAIPCFSWYSRASAILNVHVYISTQGQSFPEIVTGMCAEVRMEKERFPWPFFLLATFANYETEN